jgi:hypothetical protein
MDITSLYKQLKPGFISVGVKLEQKPVIFYDLFQPTIKSADLRNYPTYEVTGDDEMRIDLIFQNIYELESDQVRYYYKEVDALLSINNISNPLNIKKGTILKYVPIGEYEGLRIIETDSLVNKKSISQKLGYPDKKTKQDKSRKDYVENNYSLPPTVNPSPVPPIRLGDGGAISVGGL